MAAKKKATKKGAPRRRAAKPTKDETVEVTTGVQLLLGNLPSDKDAKYQYETLLQLMAKSRSAAGRVSDHKTKMKESGFDVDAFVRTMRLERMDPLDLAAHLKEQARLLELRGLPVQMKLFEPKFDSAEEQAFAEGLSLGKQGKSADSARWPEDQPGGKEHMAGWLEGQQTMKLLGGKDQKDGKAKGTKAAPEGDGEGEEE